MTIPTLPGEVTSPKSRKPSTLVSPTCRRMLTRNSMLLPLACTHSHREIQDVTRSLAASTSRSWSASLPLTIALLRWMTKSLRYLTALRSPRLISAKQIGSFNRSAMKTSGGLKIWLRIRVNRARNGYVSSKSFSNNSTNSFKLRKNPRLPQACQSNLKKTITSENRLKMTKELTLKTLLRSSLSLPVPRALPLPSLQNSNSRCLRKSLTSIASRSSSTRRSTVVRTIRQALRAPMS